MKAAASANTEQRPTSGHRDALTIAVTAGGALVILLHAWAALSPSSTNWGFHYLAFYPWPVAAGICLLMAVALLPKVQSAILRRFELTAAWFQTQAAGRRRLILTAILVATLSGFWLARERTYLLGDGATIIRKLPHVERVDQIPVVWRNEPLAAFLAWKVWRIVSDVDDDTRVEMFQAMNVVAAGICLLLLARIVPLLAAGKPERILLYLFIVGGGAAQLFFGYVENYTLLYAGMFLFILASLECIAGRVHLVFPAVAFGILFTLHFSALMMAPALIVVILLMVRRGRAAEIPSALAGMVSATAVILWMTGYTIDTFAKVLVDSGGFLLPLSQIHTPYQAYPLLSPIHGLEAVNLHLLLAPFGLLICLFVFVMGRKTFPRTQQTIFLGAAAICGLAFQVLVNVELGMSRDWDVLAPYGAGLIIASGYLWCNSAAERQARLRPMVLLCMITLLHTISWIGVNADVPRSLERFRILPDPDRWGPSAETAALEELSIFYRTNFDYADATEVLAKSLRIDSMNGRLWISYGNLRFLANDTRSAIEAFIRGFSLSHPELPRVRIGAMAYNRIAGIIMEEKRPVGEAMPYLAQSIRLDSTFPDSYFNAGMCFFQLNRYDQARASFVRFLVLDPDGPDAATARRTLAELPLPANR